MADPAAMLKQLSIIQLACAAVHALTGDVASKWAALDRQEQHFMQLALQGMHGQDIVLVTVIVVIIVQLVCAVHALTGGAAAKWAALDRQEEHFMQLALQGM